MEKDKVEIIIPITENKTSNKIIHSCWFRAILPIEPVQDMVLGLPDWNKSTVNIAITRVVAKVYSRNNYIIYSSPLTRLKFSDIFYNFNYMDTAMKKFKFRLIIPLFKLMKTLPFFDEKFGDSRSLDFCLNIGTTLSLFEAVPNHFHKFSASINKVYCDFRHKEVNIELKIVFPNRLEQKNDFKNALIANGWEFC